MLELPVKKLEIVFHENSKGSPSLVVLLQNLLEGYVYLMECAFELGQKNISAPELFTDDEEGEGFEVSADLMQSDFFAEKFEQGADSAAILIGMVAAAEDHIQTLETERVACTPVASAVPEPEPTEEPKDLAWRVAALEHSLAEEKAWGEELERRNSELKRQLRLLQATHPLVEAVAGSIQAGQSK